MILLHVAFQNVAFCGSIIFIGHYLAIAVFMWMLLEGVQILLTFISVFSANSDQCGKRLSIMIVFGWGCPAVISSSCVLTNNNTYIFKFEEYEYALCWFDTTNSWLLYGPVVAITGINFVIAIVVLIILEKNRNPRLLTKAKDDSGDIRQRIRSFLVLCPLLGIPWLITVISWFVQCQNATLYIILLLLSITINSLQGVFFFLAHCILNRKVRDAIRKRFFRYKSKRSTSTSRTLPTSPETLRRHLSRIKRETLIKYETKFESIDGLTRTPSTGSNFIARTHSSGNSQNSNHAKPLDEKKSPTSITIITTAI
ncbi:uncharacterized protein TRIADDRAFT_61907 [Trichoplax adhaerens]|uniref:G-protein coupled receptors family 2 profile 2 domain-containing protein n=1 Tax=Trichoplax adhaerens TaxID=10228 RepID=B3SCB0_TRIAD|nr:hypothetical protein TRIADDRAFT_61907 [Trichoplax adhaerens]EDV19647.1 hypothetical protein TRIADDRAFT_61907 [Trichoplax adhaerens]|eukprot:XP_002117885.1 hypothetical protein TRIADDRAFT_61907 [Trichoplax adhaerens]